MRAPLTHRTAGFAAFSCLSGNLSENFAGRLRVEGRSRGLLRRRGFSTEQRLNAGHTSLEEGGAEQIDPEKGAEHQRDRE